MTYFIKVSITLILLASYGLHLIFCVQSDPLERIVQAALLAFRSVSEKVASKMEIPRIDALSPGVRYSLQLDDKAVSSMQSLLDFVDTCPMCKTVSPAAISGCWHISYISKNLLITTMNELSKLIDRLQANKPISFGKSLDMLFTSVPHYRCADITILTGENCSPMEISYIADNSFRSIVGTMNIAKNEYKMQLAPTLSLDLCLVAEENPISAHNSVLLFAQTDVFPSCSNYIILTRNGTNTDLTPYIGYISRNGAIASDNPLVRIDCF